MRSIELRFAIVSLAIVLTYVHLPTSTDTNGAASSHMRVSNGVSLNGRSLEGRQMDERAKGKLGVNGRSLEGRQMNERAKGKLGANGHNLNGRALEGQQLDERAKGRVAGNGASPQSEKSAATAASEQGGMSLISIKLPPSAQAGRICQKCR